MSVIACVRVLECGNRGRDCGRGSEGQSECVKMRDRVSKCVCVCVCVYECVCVCVCV